MNSFTNRFSRFETWREKFAKNGKPVPQDVMLSFEMLDLGLITRNKEKTRHSLFAIFC